MAKAGMISRLKKSLSRRKSKSKAMDVDETTTPTHSGDDDAVAFPQFSLLGDDIVRLIVAFVADAPMEEKLPGPIENKYKSASLISSLPFVSKKFYEMSNSEFLWGPALSRQIAKRETNHLWINGLRRHLPLEFELAEEEKTKNDDCDDDEDDSTKKEEVRCKAREEQQKRLLLIAVQKHLGNSFRYKDVYMKIVDSHIKIEAPVFIMPSQLDIGSIYGLHLFEPRYRVMVREVLQNCGNPQEARIGGKIYPVYRNGYIEYPTLIHACMGTRLGPGQMACLVQIVWCRTYEFGTADVQLLPIAWVKIDEVTVRPNSGHLFYAKGTRC